MNSRKMRETLASEEEIDNTNNSEEYEEGVDFIKSFAKYFKNVWTEIYKFQTNESNPTISDFGIKVSQLINFINELTKVINQFSILFLFVF